MRTTQLVLDSLGRVHELIPAVLDGLTTEDVLWRPDPGANSIGWLIWHLTRAEDAIVSHIAGAEQEWDTGKWNETFGLPYAAPGGGFGMSAEDVGRFTVPDPDVLRQYAEAVGALAGEVVSKLTDADLDRVIDTTYTPPVTLGVRLVSVMVETAQHIGQAAYLKGMRERATGTASAWHGYV
ncbi:mycothiol transferase [Propionicicella superfundia]|uniref:mycothiol transferase n=1 Tax=Propionicicella superfundia TaxID=348582 RepID=UPI0004072432|nr:DinB family protein [Propionicicella superfundia]